MKSENRKLDAEEENPESLHLLASDSWLLNS
jgi:hypothetical protein